MSKVRVDVRNTDMPKDMQDDAIEIATEALQKFDKDQEIANYIKNQFDTKYKTHWHCIVGKDYGACFTNEEASFIYFYISNRAIQLFKTP